MKTIVNYFFDMNNADERAIAKEYVKYGKIAIFAVALIVITKIVF